MTENMRRASYSTTENIAEGYGRYHFKENVQYFRISRGSLYELKDQLISANDFKCITAEDFSKGSNLITKALAF
jgi:four helix bundle protein